MHFSKASTYGIRSVAYIAAQGDEAVVSIRELSDRLQIPAAFLTKVMQRLATGNIVKTMRGYGGGISLHKAPSEISLKDVILTIDGEEAFQQFWLGIPEEHMKQVPAFHSKWIELNNNIDAFFTNTCMTELFPYEKINKVNDPETSSTFF